MDELVFVDGGRPVTTTIAIAEGTKSEHASVIALVRRYVADLEEFGGVRFEIEPFATAGGNLCPVLRICFWESPMREIDERDRLSYAPAKQAGRTAPLRLFRTDFCIRTEQSVAILQTVFFCPVRKVRKHADSLCEVSLGQGLPEPFDENIKGTKRAFWRSSSIELNLHLDERPRITQELALISQNFLVALACRSEAIDYRLKLLDLFLSRKRRFNALDELRVQRARGVSARRNELRVEFGREPELKFDGFGSHAAIVRTKPNTCTYFSVAPTVGACYKCTYSRCTNTGAANG
ncbi:hypothetical protein [Cupriavidus basilensis]|uniref:hypothetical protein n=1 Tax=Cupriavidus basilensis TaxID=68895 RepID=UPI0020A637E9|nr:hypothetical protein [Cupriavidus basilensis]MCP3022278.1 hypothetical protein [Cupriavidus basilensis]